MRLRLFLATGQRANRFLLKMRFFSVQGNRGRQLRRKNPSSGTTRAAKSLTIQILSGIALIQERGDLFGLYGLIRIVSESGQIWSAPRAPICLSCSLAGSRKPLNASLPLFDSWRPYQTLQAFLRPVHRLREYHTATRTSAIRSLARPSHSGGIVPCFALPARILDISARSLAVSSPTRIFVPSSMVIGRSVFCRSVRHGTLRYVVSS